MSDSKAEILRKLMSAKVVKALGEYHIAGRGQIFSADRRQHDFELLDLLNEFVSINDTLYKVRGIESTRGLLPGHFVGLLVKKVESDADN